MSNTTQKLVRCKAKGFTLIEMVIVILLVGIMAAVAIPKFVTLTDQAETAALDAGLGGLKSAVAIFIAENNGTWPTGDQLAANMEGTATCNDTDTGIRLEGITGNFPAANGCTTVMSALGNLSTDPTP